MTKNMESAKNHNSGRKKGSTGKQVTQITPMQLELLDMFAHKELSDEEIKELKDLISDYFLAKAQDELEALAVQRNWDLKEKSKEWGQAERV